MCRVCGDVHLPAPLDAGPYVAVVAAARRGLEREVCDVQRPNGGEPGPPRLLVAGRGTGRLTLAHRDAQEVSQLPRLREQRVPAWPKSVELIGQLISGKIWIFLRNNFMTFSSASFWRLFYKQNCRSATLFESSACESTASRKPWNASVRSAATLSAERKARLGGKFASEADEAVAESWSASRVRSARNSR